MPNFTLKTAVTTPYNPAASMAARHMSTRVSGSGSRGPAWKATAAAATAPGGTITLCCERQGTGWRLRVQDNGRGIPPEDLPHVTEAFYMADKSRTRARGGSGLGLSLCAAIAAAHGSKLAIESTPGAGTCVTIDLKDGEEAAPCEP